MALTDENGGIGATMLVGPANVGTGYNYPMPYPVYQTGGFGGGMGNFGGDWGWIILLLLLAGNGGWGNGFGGGFGFNNGLGYDFPWLLNGQNGINNNVSDGFRTAQLQDSVTSVRDGVSALSTQLCNCCGDMQMSIAGVNQNIGNSTAAIQNSLCQGFAGTTAAVTGAQNAISQQMYSNELNSLNRSFAEQTANMQGFNSVQSQLAQCCCDNRLATESLRATILQENCADRYEAANNTRDIIDNANRNNQAVIDKLCQLELDAKNDRISDLERQLTMANLAASQTAQTARLLDNNNAQTARLLADNAAQTTALEQYLNPVPIPAYVVQNPNCCTNSCGCGNVGGFNGTF